MPFKVAELQVGGEGVGEGTPRVPGGSQAVSSASSRDPACFRREIQPVIGAEVYRNSTVDRPPEKSAAKDDRGRKRPVSKPWRLSQQSACRECSWPDLRTVGIYGVAAPASAILGAEIKG